MLPCVEPCAGVPYCSVPPGGAAAPRAAAGRGARGGPRKPRCRRGWSRAPDGGRRGAGEAARVGAGRRGGGCRHPRRSTLSSTCGRNQTPVERPRWCLSAAGSRGSPRTPVAGRCPAPHLQPAAAASQAGAVRSRRALGAACDPALGACPGPAAARRDAARAVSLSRLVLLCYSVYSGAFRSRSLGSLCVLCFFPTSVAHLNSL